MKRVLILFTDIFNTGGVQQYNKNLCDVLAGEFGSVKFTGITLLDRRVRVNDRIWPNIKIKFCGALMTKTVQRITFVIKTLATAVMEKPAFLICCHVNLVPPALLLKKIFRLKYAVIVHGTDVWNIKNGIRYVGLKNADIIITVSNYTMERLVSNGIDREKIEIVPDAVDTSIFFPKTVNNKLADRLGLNDKRVLLTVGRLHSQERYKGHDIMLEVLGKLDERYVWLVVGEGGDLARLKQKADELNVAARTIFLGRVESEDLADYYNLCDCFIMPSKGEGFGIVFLEALACGRPVIGGNSDGTTEPLMDGRLGYLVNPDSVEDITMAINSACSAKENRTDSGYLTKEVEANFGMGAFNRRAGEIFSRYLS